jgi:hypothetical protein
MRNSFTIRIYKDETGNPVLSYLSSITISDITLVSKNSKFGGLCLHKGNQSKYKYTIELSKSFNNVSGSHSSPNLSFKGEYMDIIVKNFPRYPAFYQCKYAARNCLNGYGYVGLLNNGFPHQLNYRTIEINKA